MGLGIGECSLSNLSVLWVLLNYDLVAGCLGGFSRLDDGSCVRLVNLPLDTFDEAITECQSLGSHLVIIESQEKADLIEKYMIVQADELGR